VAAPEFLIVGRLRRAHGVRGELIVDPITDTPAEVFAAGRRVFIGTADGDPPADGASLTIEQSRPFKRSFLVRFQGLSDRDQAERMRDRFLLLAAEERTPPASGEAYYHELVGMQVELASGARVGEVAAYYDLPHGLLLEVARGEGTGVVMLPFREEFVRELQRERRRIVIDPPEGLLE